MIKPLAVVTAIGIAVTALVTPASAVPERAEYSIMRGGSEIGRHVVEIRRQGPSIDVRIDTHVKVKMAFITVYQFDQTSTERWQGNQLVALQAQTNDNGAEHQMSVRPTSAGLRVTADGHASTVDKAMLPASLWNVGIVKQPVLLNTIQGKPMHIQVTDLGSESVKAGGRNVTARHYRLVGQLERELWFDSAGTLVRMRMKGSDGSDVLYVLM